VAELSSVHRRSATPWLEKMATGHGGWQEASCTRNDVAAKPSFDGTMPRAMKPVGKPEGNVVWTRSSGTRCAIRHRHGPMGNESELGGGDWSLDDASRVVADVMVGSEVPAQTRNRDQRVGRQPRRNEVVTKRDARRLDT